MSEKSNEGKDRAGWTTLAICVVALAEAVGIVAVIVWKLTQ